MTEVTLSGFTVAFFFSILSSLLTFTVTSMVKDSKFNRINERLARIEQALKMRPDNENT